MTGPDLTRRVVLGAAGACLPLTEAGAATRYTPGANVVQTDAAPFGSPKAADSFRRLRAMGARSCSIVAFLYQQSPHDIGIVTGADPTLAQVAAGVSQAKAAGLAVTVKPHVWTPGSWAGEVAMRSDADWRRWFANFRRGLSAYARTAKEEGADAFCAGTELRHTIVRPEWREVIADMRRAFPGPLGYCAHGADEAERVPFWGELDFVGLTLYPVLGRDDAPKRWREAMRSQAARAAAVGAKAAKSVRALEVGIRSAEGAAAKPWESAEERRAEPSQRLQAEVLAGWMAELDRAGISEIQVWRWFSDPHAGGPRDTDFTIQNKAAERTLAALWR